MIDGDGLDIRLELAELLHTTLGPLCDRLKAEGHPWAPLVDRVLETYRIGRDELIAYRYGLHALGVVHAVTMAVAEEVCRVVDELVTEELDFQKWTEELNDGNAAFGDD